jgi:opacity protein-like surface antigen
MRARIALLLALVMTALLVPQTQAQAAAAKWNGKITYVQVEYGLSGWDVNRAIGWVDHYTGSDMRRAACRYGHRCIKIRTGRLGGDITGWTSWTHDFSKATITIDVAKTRTSRYSRYFGYWTKVYLLEHELGHANGLTGHPSGCSSRMYPRLRCSNGQLPPRSFTSGERWKLSKY